MRCQFHTRCVAIINNNKKKNRFRKCRRLTMGGKGPPTCLVNTRHHARFSYKLYTDRASEVACGYLDARRQHKGPIYAATRTGPSCNWTPHYAEISFHGLSLASNQSASILLILNTWLFDQFQKRCIIK